MHSRLHQYNHYHHHQHHQHHQHQQHHHHHHHHQYIITIQYNKYQMETITKTAAHHYESQVAVNQ